jgi:hypothetical protein
MFTVKQSKLILLDLEGNSLLVTPEGGRMIVRDVGSYVPFYTALHASDDNIETEVK